MADDSTASGEQNQPPSSQSTLDVPRSGGGRGPRTPRKVSAQATRLEAVDDALGPLGPLGDNSAYPPIASASDQGPTPPKKEPATSRNARPTSASASASQSLAGSGMMDSVDLEDDTGLTSPKLKAPPPVQPPQDDGEGPKRQSQPSMSVEQAAKPKFDITVGDPHKVGDLATSHIVYQVRTKVRA